MRLLRRTFRCAEVLDDLELHVPSNGFTPLHRAAQRGHIDVLKVLAPITKIPNGGKGLISWANFSEHYEFARVLQSYVNTGLF